jgi:hypothetical protein
MMVLVEIFLEGFAVRIDKKTVVYKSGLGKGGMLAHETRESGRAYQP